MTPIEAFPGNMEAGKSEEEFRQLNRLEAIGKRVGREILIFTYAGDDRFGKGKITTRAYGGMERDAIAVNTALEMMMYLNEFENIDELEHIFFDEAAFLKDSTEDLVNILQGIDEELGITIHLFFLDTDFRDHPIGHAGTLLIIAKDNADRLSSYCSHINEDGSVCGAAARYTSRFHEDGTPVPYDDEIEQIGAKQYAGRCKHHKLRPGKPGLVDFGFTNFPQHHTKQT